MRKKLFLMLLKIVNGFISVLLCFISIFAIQIGIDNDPGWGKGRFILLLLGVIFAFIFIALQYPSITKKIKHTLISSNQKMLNRKMNPRVSRFSAIFSKYPILKSAQWQRFFFGAIGVLLVIITFRGVIHSKYVHIQPTDYYNQLADGFLAGQTSLPEKPPQALSDLENPYNWLNREGINLLWDASFYKGEYYLYWGMVPALIAAAMKTLHPMIISDQYLVWGFFIGICILMALLFSSMHRRFFPKQPVWLILPFTWISGAAMPMLWLTTRPSVYEAAIAGGQFFFLLGIYAIFQFFWADQKSDLWLFLAGFSWGAAVNCRFSLVITTIWLAGIISFFVFRQSQINRKNWIASMLYLFIPLSLWAATLLGYNYLRFGNIFEMGHRYQLNGPGMPAEYDQVMSLQYVIPSMYSYLIRPLQFELNTFPYVSIPFISESMWPFFIQLPKYYYYPEPTAGILLTTPIVWFSFFPLIQLARRFHQWLEEKPRQKLGPKQQSFVQFEWLIISAIIITFFFLLIFNAASMRYLADVSPMSILLSIAGSWWIFQHTEKQPLFHSVMVLLIILLITYSGIVSIYGSFSPHY